MTEESVALKIETVVSGEQRVKGCEGREKVSWILRARRDSITYNWRLKVSG